MKADKSRGQIWGKRALAEEKRSIKMELEGASRLGGPAERLILAMSRIRELESDLTSLGQLRRYIYVVSALFHHVNHGGLKLRQIQNLFELGYAILRVQGIPPKGTKLGSLYGDLHLVMSQIHRKEGFHWKAAWEHQVSFHLSCISPTGGKGFQALAMAIRSLRLGYTELAIGELQKAEMFGLSDPSLVRAYLERLKALRLKGDLEKAQSLEEKLSQKQLSDEENLEKEWETLCRKVQRTGNISDLVRSVHRNKSHHHYTYILEAFLWTRAVQSREYLHLYPTLRRLSRNPQIKLKMKDFLYKSVIVLEQCYDYSIPYAVRIRRLGNVLSRANSFASVDTELLFLAASARWLSRGRTYGFTALVVNEYRSLSLRLTQGKSDDVLNVVSDIRLGTDGGRDSRVVIEAA